MSQADDQTTPDTDDPELDLEDAELDGTGGDPTEDGASELAMASDSATRWCPACGGEFVASLDECPDCSVGLVATRPTGITAGAVSRGQLEYDLAEWASASRLMVQQILTSEHVPFAWQGTTLLVPGPFEAQADRIVDEVEASAPRELDTSAELVAYELDEWSDDQVSELCAILETEAIPYGFDAEGDLLVEQADDPRVEEIIAGMSEEPAPGNGSADRRAAEAAEGADGEDSDDDGDDDGDDDDEDEDEEGIEVDAGRLLSDLFVAADRLRRKAADHEGVLGLVDNAAIARSAALPYGFEPQVWSGLLDRVDAVVALLEDDESSDEDVEAEASALRDALREYV